MAIVQIVKRKAWALWLAGGHSILGLQHHYGSKPVRRIK